MKTKPRRGIAEIRALLSAANWRDAIKMAAGFRDLGKQADVIKTAWSAIQHPAFYEGIGKRPDILINAGIDALKKRYGDPDKNFQDSDFE